MFVVVSLLIAPLSILQPLIIMILNTRCFLLPRCISLLFQAFIFQSSSVLLLDLLNSLLELHLFFCMHLLQLLVEVFCRGYLQSLNKLVLLCLELVPEASLDFSRVSFVLCLELQIQNLQFAMKVILIYLRLLVLNLSFRFNSSLFAQSLFPALQSLIIML